MHWRKSFRLSRPCGEAEQCCAVWQHCTSTGGVHSVMLWGQGGRRSYRFGSRSLWLACERNILRPIHHSYSLQCLRNLSRSKPEQLTSPTVRQPLAHVARGRVALDCAGEFCRLPDEVWVTYRSFGCRWFTVVQTSIISIIVSFWQHRAKTSLVDGTVARARERPRVPTFCTHNKAYKESHSHALRLYPIGGTLATRVKRDAYCK